MSTSARQLARVISRPVKKLQKPRPLKTQNVTRHSAIDTANINVFDEIMVLAEAVASNLSNGNFDRNLKSNIVSLSGLLKNYGHSLEVIYKDQLDRAFVIFRNGCRDENLDYTSRLHLLELIELRAMQWTTADSTSYYKHKYNHPDIDILSISSLDSSLSSGSVFQNAQMLNSVHSAVPQPLLLGPGELVKSSGKFAAPTKIPGKNFCKDEVVIRNSDSGKVMGIKGRRVHMIEELSETVISFQRVNPGAKERLVQITGPSEDKIIYAKQLMEETIKRNASPVRSEMLDKERLGSNSSLNSTASEDSSRFGSLSESSKRTTLLHSFSTSDATIGEYKYTVTIGHDTLKITGTNPDLVTIAKLVLDEYFLSESNDQLIENEYEDGANFFDRIYIPENEEETFGVQHCISPSSVVKSPSFKDIGSHGEIPTTRNFETEKISVKKERSPSIKEGAGVPESAVAQSPKKSAFRFSGDFSPANTDVSPKPIKTYSCEKIIFLAESPLSRQSPEDWARITKEFPAIVKKPPIDWFEPNTYMKERPQESDALNSIQSVAEVSIPDPE